MAIESFSTLQVDLPTLKRIKNSVIGNRSAKEKLSLDPPFITRVVQCLINPPLSQPEEIQTEAAHIIASLAYGSNKALECLLDSDGLSTLLAALQPSTTRRPGLTAALSRALRALGASVADIATSSPWGPPSTTKSSLFLKAQAALDFLFEAESLDVYLPLLICCPVSIAYLLKATVREDTQLEVLTWLPLEEREVELGVKRGWEKTTQSKAPYRMGGWVVRHLVALTLSRDAKIQEAACLALGAVVSDQKEVAETLTKESAEHGGSSVLHSVITLSKSRFPEVQLAACSCAVGIIRASQLSDLTPPLAVMHVLNRILSATELTLNVPTTECMRIHAMTALTLYHLIKDNAELCEKAYHRGSLTRLGNIIVAIDPEETTEDWDSDESAAICSLRAAALTAVSAMTLFSQDLRREAAEYAGLVPAIYKALSHSNVEVRYAASMCVRTLSRSIDVVRVNIVDSGLAMAIFELFMKEHEERKVTYACLLGVCNLLNQFSPLRQTFLERGLLFRLGQLTRSEMPELRFNALWALKNLVCDSTYDMKLAVMEQIQWPELARLLQHELHNIQEQSWTLLRNIAADEDGAAMILHQYAHGDLLRWAVTAMESDDNEDVHAQVAYALANLANGEPIFAGHTLANRRILDAIHECLAGKPESRKAAIYTVFELIRSHPHRSNELKEVGIVRTLRHISAASASPIVSTLVNRRVDDTREVVDLARKALDEMGAEW